tara:strand:+ start:1891 stop:7332 length:5442 start_codon:yes stop_codon:yes gene_type:complete
MAQKQQPQKRFLKGLFKDTAHIDQPEGSWRYARNVILNEKKGSLSNEGGNQILGLIPDLDIVIGAVEITNDKAIIFYIDIQGVSIIGKWEDGIFQVVYRPDIPVYGDKVNLKFNKNYPIEGTFNINPEGELLVYWTDDLNPPRVLNITRQLKSNTTFIYNIDPNTSHDNHIDLLNLFPNSGPVPHIDLSEIAIGPDTYQVATKEGGGLLTGVYYLALAYVDDSYTATNYLTMSNPISIVDEGDHTRPTTKKDGAPEATQTAKSITWKVDNMNKDYKSIRPVIIRKMGAAVDAYRLNDVKIPLVATTMNITFSGIEGFTPTSLEDVIIDTISYETAKTINQLDGILYVGNTTSVEDLGYQKYANNIKLNAVTKTFENFDENVLSVDNLETGFNSYPVDVTGWMGQWDHDIDHSKSYRYVPNIFKYKGYMRDEVYAFYIAFILNDGSMSYAYHIPGRASTGTDTDPLENERWFKEFINLSPTIIRQFHLHDFSDTANYPNNRNMNYWENATELYPETDNFEVWDGLTQGTDLKGTKVRHHHFPSNGNPTHKTIHDNTSVVTGSQGIVYTTKNWVSKDNIDGTSNPTEEFSIVYADPAGGQSSGSFNLPMDAWKICRFGPGVVGTDIIVTTPTSPTPLPDMYAALWKNQRYFVADQPMQVRVHWNVIIYRGSTGGSNEHYGKTQLVKEKAGGQISSIYTDNWELSSGNSTLTSNGAQPWTAVQHLDVGDKIYLRTMQTTDNPAGSGTSDPNTWVRHMGTYGSWENNIHFEVLSEQGNYQADDLHDVKLSHTVKALGFELEDVKIPSSIANKIQGFRIFRAKRKHEDKRILGQSVITPMLPDQTVLGRCSETAGNTDASQIMSSAFSLREMVLTKDPWTRGYSSFPEYPIMYRHNNGSYIPDLVDKRGYKYFSFNDFNLLRTQNSLAGATHIKPEYYIRNFVWNAPTINQLKKMVSKIIEDDGNDAYSEPIKKIEQFWGWDTDFNCYSKEITGAIFAGCSYTAVNSLDLLDESTNDIRGTFAAPRLIGQKAKSYIPGDSIFQASALGFGGKISNEFGESSLVFGLADTHEFYSSGLISNRGGDTYVDPVTGDISSPGSGLSTPALASYGRYHPNTPSILVNPLLLGNDPYQNPPYTYSDLEEIRNRRSQVLMANLHAFKTDMYKSIDNQELVWTGFEVLGDDLDNFTFDDETGDTGSSDFTTKTIQPEGIFGGDTFICRYGFRSTLNHNSIDESCIPMRAIHYQIVESVDNINFRHSESDADLYFPGSIAKRVLGTDGVSDFTHQDNLNYDDSFSADNDLRPAFPLPLKEIEQTEFPTRAHRSVKRDTTSLTDNYRIFLANEYKDVAKNRGELWKLSTFNNLLYFHMEESLYVTKGKQQMQMKDGSEAFVGSGDIFQQEPDEIMQADKGYGGTQSQWAALTCNHGYFFVDVNSRKVFLMKDKLSEVSTAGLENWFKDNLPFALEQYGYNTPCISKIFDNPLISLGLTSVYDPKFKRIILTKRDLAPTTDFITGYNLYIDYITSNAANTVYVGGEIFFDCEEGQYVQVTVNDNPGGPNTYSFFVIDWDNKLFFTPSGWTISYYPEFNIWGGFHDYTPYIYFNTSENFYSLTDNNYNIWEHNSNVRGSFYGTINPFEIEYIHNEFREEDALLGSFNYTLETFNRQNISVLEHGFTSFFVYNTLQISADNISDSVVVPTPLEYLVNIRRVGNNWKINKFRDMAAIALDTNTYYMAGTLANPNIIGGANTGTITTSSTANMFIIDGMSEIINPNYINITKEWQNRKKFTDKWTGIRLICNNINNNLLNLYAAQAVVRKTYK